MLHNAVCERTGPCAGPQLPHVRRGARRVQPRCLSGSFDRSGFDFARCRSKECSHTGRSNGDPPARPGRSGPFGIEAAAGGETRAAGGIQIPLNQGNSWCRRLRLVRGHPSGG
jgi:hypothetical protein